MRNLMNSAEAARSNVGISGACHALALPRATFYRWRKPRTAYAASAGERTCRVPGVAVSLGEESGNELLPSLIPSASWIRRLLKSTPLF